MFTRRHVFVCPFLVRSHFQFFSHVVLLFACVSITCWSAYHVCRFLNFHVLRANRWFFVLFCVFLFHVFDTSLCHSVAYVPLFFSVPSFHVVRALCLVVSTCCVFRSASQHVSILQVFSVCSCTMFALVSIYGRGAGTHGDVLNVHTGVFSVPHHTACTHCDHNHSHNDTHHTPQHNTATTTHIITRRQGRRNRQRQTGTDRQGQRETELESGLASTCCTLCIKPFCFAFDQMSSWYSAAGYGWCGSSGSW